MMRHAQHHLSSLYSLVYGCLLAKILPTGLLLYSVFFCFLDLDLIRPNCFSAPTMMTFPQMTYKTDKNIRKNCHLWST